jgi:hypothetical protein
MKVVILCYGQFRQADMVFEKNVKEITQQFPESQFHFIFLTQDFRPEHQTFIESHLQSHS